jgi:hypothetical protein
MNRAYSSLYSLPSKHTSFDVYCVRLLQIVNLGISLNNTQWVKQTNPVYPGAIERSAAETTIAVQNDKIIKLTNEAIYHIVKYMSKYPTVYQPSLCTKIIRRYMTGRLKIGNNKTTLTIPENIKLNGTGSEKNRMILTIPESEKQRDIVWLAKYMHMFNRDIRQEYINRLSKHMLIFINKHREKYGKGILRMSQKKLNKREQKI